MIFVRIIELNSDVVKNVWTFNFKFLNNKYLQDAAKCVIDND